MAKEIISRDDTRRYWGAWLFRKKFDHVVFSDVIFDNVTFKYANFNKCTWRSCIFKNCHFSDYTEFKECLWENCTFSGKYSSICGANFYESEFRNVALKSSLVQRITFSNCSFSGHFSNLIFIGSKDDKNNWATSFTNCDLSEVELDNVSFVSGVDLKSVRLPRRGIRVFSNIGNKFTDAIIKASLQLEQNDVIPLQVYAESSKGQEIVVFDNLTSEYLFKGAEKGKVIFDSLAKEFEIAR